MTRWLSLLAVLGAVAARADEPARPLPISAHNCYPADSTSRDRLALAVKLGIDNIEIDLGWDEARRRLIVGHDPAPRPGLAYPEFAEYLVPALVAPWQTPRADRAPTVLTIDWKTAHPDAIQAFHAFLGRHADWFSSAPKADKSSLTERRVTVCFTGSDEAKTRYDALVPAGGEYRAFRDVVFGGGDYKKDVADYAPSPATAYHRFLTFHWGVIERGGPPLAGAWSEEEAARLSTLVRHAHAQGYRVRFYCLDGHTGPRVSPYRFADDATARLRWRAAAQAGVDWVASDEYEAIVAELK
jgi:hypothetical protein